MSDEQRATSITKTESMLRRISSKYPRAFQVVMHGLFPLFFYFALFCVLTFPLMGRFFTHFFSDRRDGMQNVWNLWWVNLVVRRPDLYPSIWQTRLLHWPFGTTLVGHDLDAFNGYLAAGLLRFLPLQARYNAIVLFGFVIAGLTAYWLCYEVTRAYWPSILAGCLYTFSSFHFMHVQAGHLEMVSMEWIPLFLLCWIVLLRRPGPWIAAGTAVVLWFVILCSDYYFLYCILAAILIFVWFAILRHGVRFVLKREYLIALATFAAISLVLNGPLVGQVLISNARDPLVGAHDPTIASLDLLALFIPGTTWLFNDWTAAYRSSLAGGLKEGQVYLSLSAFVLVAYLWIRQRRLDPVSRQQLALWSAVGAFFFLLSLGPVLQAGGMAIWHRFMPYTLLARVLPFLVISGVPARMTVMVILAAAMLSALGIRELFRATTRSRIVALVLLGIFIFQSLPARIITTSTSVPDYVTALKRLPNDGGVLSLVPTNRGMELYYQTVHGKPITFGYISRVPASVMAKDRELSKAIAAQDYAALWNIYHIRYIIAGRQLPAHDAHQADIELNAVYERNDIRIYRLGCTCEP